MIGKTLPKRGKILLMAEVEEKPAQREKIIGKGAKIKKLPIQPGDVKKTWANIHKASNLLDWRPYINLQHGIQKTVKSFLRLQLK